MAAWQPPIPAGTLYSESALRLGPALALLAWCYDRVERDGTLKFRLESASTDIGRPYGTIRDWWRLLRESEFFSDLTDHGRNGWVARFHPDYLDWRIMRRNYPEESTTNERRDVSVEEPKQPEEPAQREMNEISTLNQSRDVSVDDNAYKVLHDDQEKHVVRRRASAPDEPPTPKEIREAIAKGSQIDLKAGLQADIVQVNKTAKHLWKHMRKPDQSVESLVADIRLVGRWVRQTQYPYKDSDQRVPPSALIKFWPAAIEAQKTRAAPAVNGTNGYHPSPIPVAPPGELATPDDWHLLTAGLNGIGTLNDASTTTPQPRRRERPDRFPSGES